MIRNIPVPTIVGPRFTLRPFKKSDAASLRTAINDRRVARDVTNIPFPYTRKHARAWINATEQVITETSRRVDFAIVKDDKVIGSMSLMNLEGHKAQVSYWVTPTEWKQGIASEALKQLLAFGFENMQLVRIYAYVYAENKASAGVLTKSGFSFEGVHRKEWRKVIDGEVRFFDSHYYAIVKE